MTLKKLVKKRKGGLVGCRYNFKEEWRNIMQENAAISVIKSESA